MTGLDYVTQISTPDPMTRDITDTSAVGPGLFTPGQQDFRVIAQGFDGDAQHSADRGGAGHSVLNRITRHPDGTTDYVRMEPTDEGWIDPGGPTPSDFKAVLP